MVPVPVGDYVDPFADKGNDTRDERVRKLYEDERKQGYMKNPFRGGDNPGHSGRMRQLEDMIARETPDSPVRSSE